MSRPKGSCGTNSKFKYIKDLLDTENIICRYTTNDSDLRKTISRLRSHYDYVIYRDTCKCGLSKRKHFCYEKDWASDFQSLEKVNTIHYEDVK